MDTRGLNGVAELSFDELRSVVELVHLSVDARQLARHVGLRVRVPLHTFLLRTTTPTTSQSQSLPQPLQLFTRLEK